MKFFDKVKLALVIAKEAVQKFIAGDIMKRDANQMIDAMSLITDLPAAIESASRKGSELGSEARVEKQKAQEDLAKAEKKIADGEKYSQVAKILARK